MLEFKNEILVARYGNVNKLLKSPLEGLIVLLARVHILLPKGLQFPKLTKLSLEGLSVSSGGIIIKNHA